MEQSSADCDDEARACAVSSQLGWMSNLLLHLSEAESFWRSSSWGDLGA